MMIGLEQKTEQIATMLRSLGCDVTFSRSVLKATPPTWRVDLHAEEDLIEEVARLVGYDNVPATLPPGARIGGLTAEQQRRRRLHVALQGAGCFEASTLSLIPPWIPDRLGFGANHPWRSAPRLANPLSEDESVLRPALLPGLLLAAQHNATHRVMPVRLYEIGAVYARDGDAVAQHERVAWILAGPALTSWHGTERALDFFDARGVLEHVMSALGIDGWTVEQTDARGEPVHPGRVARVVIDGEHAGTIAELHPRLADAFDLPSRVAFCELALAPLVRAREQVRAHELPRFPALTRDIALIVPSDEQAAAVQHRLREAGGGLLESIELFDVYRGSGIGEGKVSLAFSLSFRAPDRTLTDFEVDEAMGSIQGAARAVGWQVRE
jgi:phenylalanyl-tRNA synthetase beta chain